MAEKAVLDSLFRPAIFVVTLLSLGLIGHWLLTLELDGDFLDLLSAGWLLPAFAIQLSAILLVLFCWKWILQLNGAGHVSVRDSIAMMGLNAIGKYAPGKVAGALARGSWMLRRKQDAGLVVQSTLVEQAAVLHGGVILAGLAWSMRGPDPFWVWLGIPVALVSVIVVSGSGSWLAVLIAQLLHRPVSPVAAGKAFARSYLFAFVCMMLVWLTAVLVLLCCLLALGQGDAVDIPWLAFVLAMGYLGGFAAFFLPAGIGAREGVMAVLLSAQMDPGIAVYVTFLHRVIALLADLLLALLAFLQSRREAGEG